MDGVVDSLLGAICLLFVLTFALASLCFAQTCVTRWLLVFFSVFCDGPHQIFSTATYVDHSNSLDTHSADQKMVSRMGIITSLIFLLCSHASFAHSIHTQPNLLPHPLSFHKGIGPLTSLKTYVPHPTSNGTPRPGVQNCSFFWYNQTINHFPSSSSTAETTFQQRYFVNTDHWDKKGPILLYAGNEANVEVYINATGFMWENAPSLHAALLFIEHRYYGQSIPFDLPLDDPNYDFRKDEDKLQFLTVEQALADYASILTHFKQDCNAEDCPVIVLGGSYGGMLAAWFRLTYPHLVDGAIAASAPLLAFLEDVPSAFGHGESYWQIVTSDASEKGGSAPECSSNVREAFQALFHLADQSQGLETLTNIFHPCQPFQSMQDVHKLSLYHLNAWDSMAMGNYPYPSNYLIYQQTNDASIQLPAFPVRAACNHMSGAFNHNDTARLLSALRDAGNVYYNATGTEHCFDLPEDVNFDGIWDYQFCTELLPQETCFKRDGIHDMFWSFDLNHSLITEHCVKSFPASSGPNWSWMKDMFQEVEQKLTNVVLTNGAYDPWTAGGILPPGLSESVPSFMIEEGAHHLDLMFSDLEHDPISVVNVRKMEMEYIRKWIVEKKQKEGLSRLGLRDKFEMD
mmetsp:Transcript_8029/g.11883  ORF Transcript_8029/g.11883 Transcript_8029/m.11883 type:complete len:629 (+) Transcript_8029:96-1982(+)